MSNQKACLAKVALSSPLAADRMVCVQHEASATVPYTLLEGPQQSLLERCRFLLRLQNAACGTAELLQDQSLLADKSMIRCGLLLATGSNSGKYQKQVCLCVSTPVPKEFAQNNSLSVKCTRFAGGPGSCELALDQRRRAHNW